MDFSKMTCQQVYWETERWQSVDDIPEKSLIYIGEVVNFISCKRYLAKCEDGIIDFTVKQHSNSSDIEIYFNRVLDLQNYKEEVKKEIEQIQIQANQEIELEEMVLKRL